jgi:hypothetical protein
VTPKAQPGWGKLFMVWLGLFAGIAFVLWVAIEFWGRNLRLAPSPEVIAANPSPGVRVLPPANNAPVIHLEQVTESNARLSFVGRTVQFNNVIVTEVGRLTFRVGTDSGQTLLAASSDREHPNVRVGQHVDLEGLILNVQDAPTIEKLWDLNPAQAERAEGEQVYLWASTVKKI